MNRLLLKRLMMTSRDTVLAVGVLTMVSAPAVKTYVVPLILAIAGLLALSYDTVRRGKKFGDRRRFLHLHRSNYIWSAAFAAVPIIGTLGTPGGVCLGVTALTWCVEIGYDNPPVKGWFKVFRITRADKRGSSSKITGANHGQR